MGTNTQVDIPHGYVHVEVSDTGAVIHGARVYLFSETGAYLNRYMETDAFGDASLFIPEGAYKFRVDYDGRQYWSDTVHTIADEALDLPLDIGLLARDQTNDPLPRRYHGTPPKFEPQPVYLASLMSLPGILSQTTFGATPQDAVYYFLNDHLGTPLNLLDESGAVVWEADYEPFGGAKIGTQSFSNNFRFPGQYFDSETRLHYNYHRYYNPTIGRYLTPDPIGLDGGINLFAYVKNNPLRWRDPIGLEDDSKYNSYGGGFSASLIWTVSSGAKTYECDDDANKRHVMTVSYFCYGMDIGLGVKTGGHAAISDKKDVGSCPKLNRSDSWVSSHGSAVYGALPFFGRSYDIDNDEEGTIFGFGGGYRLWMECHNHIEQDVIKGFAGD
jgi:RHS repeat-associated protein